MAKAYTTSTASIKVPVALSFTCPKCGQHSTVSRTALLSAQATVRGYNSSAAGTFARQNLAASADQQIKTVTNFLEQGDLRVLLDQSGKNVSGKVLCPKCGLRQIVDIPEKRRTLYPKAFAGIIVGLVFLILFVFTFTVALSAAGGQTRVSPGLVSGAELLCIAAVAAVIILNRSRSKKAYSDPALMEKRYGGVLNPHMDATLMLGIGSVIHVDIPRRG